MNRDDVLELMRLLQRALDYREEDMRPLEEVEKIKMRHSNLHMIVGDYGITKLSKVGFNSERDSLISRIEALEDKVGVIATHTMPLFFADDGRGQL